MLKEVKSQLKKAPQEPGVYPVRSHGRVRIPKKGKPDFNLLPTSNGVYFFKDKNGHTLYIGKAVNLKNRVKQYFEGSQRISTPFLEHLIQEARKIEFKTTGSEIEALILESQCIKKLQPRYNITLRDDKQYFYVGFTKDSFPKVFLTHQPVKFRNSNIETRNKFQISNSKFQTVSDFGFRASDFSYIGPFTNGSALKSTLRLLRKVFPYCTCKQKHNNFCLNYHIGKCPGICCSRFSLREAQLENRGSSISHLRNMSEEKSGLKNHETQNMKPETQNYRKNIKAIKDILSGKRELLIKKLKKDLDKLAKKERFEEAIELKNKIEKLERVFENAKILKHNANLRMYANDANVLTELKKIFKLPTLPKRIEGYDVSNIQGNYATGAMVVFTPVPSAFGGATGQANYQPDKNEYRKFRIRTKTTPNDVAMLKEVLTRRFNHPEWQFPDLIFVDGGKAQLNTAKAVISNVKNVKILRFHRESSMPTKSSILDKVGTKSGQMSNQFQSSNDKIPIIALAKGKKEIFSTTIKNPIHLNKLSSDIRNLIKQIDHEAHRFAIGYYRKLHRIAI